MARVVVTSCMYLGDTTPFVPVARRLHEAGHDVTFVAPDGFGSVLEPEPFDHAPYALDCSPAALDADPGPHEADAAPVHERHPVGDPVDGPCLRRRPCGGHRIAA